MRSRRKLALLAAAGALAVALAVVALRPDRVPVGTATAARGPLEVTVEGSGRTRVRERFDVLAPVAGDLQRVEIHAGDPVEAGQVVARVAPAIPTLLDARTRAELSARLAAARAAEAEGRATLERARISAADAARQRERVGALGVGGAASERDVEAAMFAARVAAEEVHAAESAFVRAGREAQAARAALLGATEAGAGRAVPVLAPVQGKVLRVLRESGGPVAAGTPLLEIGDPTRLEIVVDLLTSDAVRVRSGAPARVTGWGGGAALAAVVRRVEPSAFTKVSPLGVEEQRVNVVLDPEPGAEGWETLGDGYAVEVAVVVERREDAVKVPASALFRAADGWAVFAVEEGIARRRPVGVAARGAREAAIAEGVAAGDRIVVHPSDRVEDGTRVVEE